MFLFCPRRKKFSAWSLFLTVDKSDPSKVLAVGLDKLVGKNSLDLDGYEAVLAAQQAPQTARELLGTLAARDFASGELWIEKDNALHVSLKPLGPDSYRLFVSLRINADQRFVIGGKEQSKRDVVLRFDRNKGKWAACAVVLLDYEGKNLVSHGARKLSGIFFPVEGTGIQSIYGVLEGEAVAVTLMDLAGMRKED